MIRRTSTILILTALLFTLMTLSAFAAKSANETRLVNKVAIRVVDYAFPDEQQGFSDEGVTAERVSLDRSKNSNAVGHLVGNSYYEWQHNSSMHRQIAIGSSAPCPWTLHVDYMYLPTGVLENREIEAFGYDGGANPGTQAYFYSGFQAAGAYAGYPSLDIVSGAETDLNSAGDPILNNRSIVVAHNRVVSGGRYRIQYWFQFECNLSFYGASDRIPDSLNDCGAVAVDPADAEVVWPDIQYQDPPDGPPILHLVGSAFGGGSGASNLNYFQKLNPEGTGDDPEGGSWTYGCAIDTVFNGEGYELAANDNGTIVISWVALLPDEAGCDTCSQNTTTGSGGRDRWDNDFYYQKNDNYGRGEIGALFDGTTNFWQNRVNVTRNVADEDGFRPYADIITMITSDGDLHAAWIAMEWDEPEPGTYRSRVQHWGENNGFDANTNQGNVRTVASAQWDPVNCNSGAFNQNQAKLSIAECNNKLYVMWVEMNSPWTTGNDNQDDCAQRAFDGDFGGAANGDLFISVSDDMGLTWDAPRPLTDTYGGPTGTGSGLGCDPAGVEGDCPSEHWPTMAEFGTNYAINPPNGEVADWNTSTALVGTGDNGYYLDIAYFNDTDPGGAVMSQGSWTDNDYLWMRFPCVDPIPAPGFAMSPSGYAFPNCLHHCETYVENVLIENIGNVGLNYSYTITEDQVSPSGWLAAANISTEDGVVPSGVNNKDTLLVTLNVGGNICAAGTIVKVTGRVTITHDAAVPEGVYEVELVLADTCVLPVWDSVSTSCTDLIVGTNGNAGNAGSPGGAHMDYASEFPSEPDSTADAYLYDSGDIVGWMNGANAYMNWGMFQATISDSVALMPQAWTTPGSFTAPYNVPADYFYTGTYTTNDTSLVFESEWYAPTDAGYSCGFVIKHVKVYVNDGLPKSGVVLGIVTDWDVPSDSSSSDNAHGFGPTPNMVWQSGVEYDADDAWLNSDRYGAMLYLGGYNCSSAPYAPEQFAPGGTPDEKFADPYGMYTGSNSRLVYPYDLGFNSDTLYMMQSLAGENLSDSLEQDMHSGITYLHNRDIAANDTLHFFVAFLSNVDDTYPAATNKGIGNIAADAIAFYTDWLAMAGGCCDNAGDANKDGTVGISDLTYFVDFMFNSGPAPECGDEFDNNADCSLGISDLTYFVDFMFNSGPAPECGCVE